MTARPEMLPSGRYRAITYNPHAKRRGPTQTFDTFAEAYAWAKATEREMDRQIREHGIEVARRGGPVTFADYANAWNVSGPITSQHTAKSHARVLARVWPTERLADITPVMVKAMLHDMQVRGLAVSTRSTRLSMLRKLFAAAVEDGYRADNPCAGVRAPKVPVDAGRHRNITDAELDKILAGMPEWTHAAVLLSRDAGLRIAEVCGLPWHRVDLLHGRVTVSDVVLMDRTIRTSPKGGQVLTVALTPRTVAALRTHQEEWPGGARDRVFREPGQGGEFVTTARLRVLWKRAVAAAGLDYPAPRWHDLRHSRGHALADAGAPIQVIQAILRHENIGTTRKYMGAVTVQEQARWMQAADNPQRPVAV